jgi:hypothetical protein
MAKVALLQFDTDPECAERRELLAMLGASLVVAEPRWPVFFDTIERERPDVIVIACSIIAQHAREAARYLGDGFNTRNIPVILVDVKPEDLNATKASAPSAAIVDRAQLASAVRARLPAA